jgi:hypothetical protein
VGAVVIGFGFMLFGRVIWVFFVLFCCFFDFFSFFCAVLRFEALS